MPCAPSGERISTPIAAASHDMASTNRASSPMAASQWPTPARGEKPIAKATPRPGPPRPGCAPRWPRRGRRAATAAHVQRAEAVDDPAGQVGGHADRGGAGAEADAHQQHAGDDVVDVAPADVDGAPEEVDEHDHQHHRQRQRGDQAVDVAQRQSQRADDHRGQLGQPGSPAGAGGFVNGNVNGQRDRSAQSSVGSLSRSWRCAGEGQENVVEAGGADREVGDPRAVGVELVEQRARHRARRRRRRPPASAAHGPGPRRARPRLARPHRTRPSTAAERQAATGHRRLELCRACPRRRSRPGRARRFGRQARRPPPGTAWSETR